MKFLLLAAAIGVATGSRVRVAPLPSVRTARQHEPVPSTADASDALGGVLDAVNDSFTRVRNALGAIDSGCHSELALIAERAQSRDAALQGLDGARLQNLAEVGGLQAELAHLEKSEAQTKSSYDSTVAQRASEARTYADWQAASTQQESVLSSVLSMLKQRQATASAVGGCSNASSSGSQMGSVIGVIQGLLSTVSQAIVDEAAAHALKDSQLLDLVGSHLDSLQRVDGESETSSVRLSVARAAVDHLATEAALLHEASAADESAAAALRQLCGASGEVHGALAALEQGVQALKTQVEQTLLSIDELQKQDILSAPGRGVRLLQVVPGARGARGAPPQRAARWLAMARARGLVPFKAPPVLHLQHQERSILGGAGRSTLGGAARAGHLRAAVAAEAALVAPAPAPPVVKPNDTEECVRRKQQLAAELLVSRQAERQHRAQAAEAEALEAAVGQWLMLLEERASATSAAEGALGAAWQAPLHLQQGADITHASASAFCTAQGGRLCRAGELCPRGSLSAGPVGAALAGTHWAPVGDASNEWLHVGTQQFSACQLASGVSEQLRWVVSEAPDPSKGEVYCCQATLPLDAVVGQAGLASVLADSLLEVEEVKANLTAYAAASPMALAATLPTAVAAIASTLSATKEQLTKDADSLLNLYRDLEGQYSSAAGQLQHNMTTFRANRTAANETRTKALEAAVAEDNAQSKLRAEQLALRAHCENVTHGNFTDGNATPHVGNGTLGNGTL